MRRTSFFFNPQAEQRSETMDTIIFLTETKANRNSLPFNPPERYEIAANSIVVAFSSGFPGWKYVGTGIETPSGGDYRS